ncbi:MAG TPA: type II CRISPR-associated endonuclease Cas1 [Longimicrobiales bacterium]|nr:type II CRISPR-associated endonuclease Cas1 [Longimicrobiales bacterium]
MTDRLIDLAETQATVRVRGRLLTIETGGQSPITVPPGELGAVAIAPQATLTGAVLALLAEHNVSLVVSDSRRMPIAMLLPLAGNYVQAERFRRQATATLPARKRIWKQIVVAKVRNQAKVLERIRGTDCGLRDLARKVRSGDTTNIEGQAARRYWPHVFTIPDFRRNPDATDGLNRRLNYGYAILRGIVSRAICAAGLHPSLGLHHHNRYNPFCLADDLMEPLRPLVDYHIALRADANTLADAELGPQQKRAIIEPLMGKFRFGNSQRMIFDIAARMATSLVKVFEGTAEKLSIPELWGRE